MKKLGFTIIDLVVSIGIFALITSAVVANFRVGQYGDSVRQSAAISVGFLREAQTMALTMAAESGGDSMPIGGYGVRFQEEPNPREIILFADYDGDYSFDEGEKIKSEILPKEVVPVLYENLDIVFSWPNAEIRFNGQKDEVLKKIKFGSPYTNKLTEISIYRLSGQIRVENLSLMSSPQ